MKKTTLTDKHIELGAKMAEFAGYNMPISYSNIRDEHNNVRQNVGVFDCSHMGEFFVSGAGALELVQKVTSNDAAKLILGQAQYSCLPNNEGGIVDDLLVYKMPDDQNGAVFMLVVNASNIKKDWDWIVKNNESIGAELSNQSYDFGLLAIQGPKAQKVLQKLTNVSLDDIPFYHFAIGEFAGIEDAIISATGYTGAGGFEIYVKESKLPQLWDAIFKNGKEEGIMPAGLGARDTLRLEMGYCLYGNDINDKTSPIEAGLGWITKLKKGDFNGSEIIAALKAEGMKKKLIGFELSDRRVPRHDYAIVDEHENKIGIVTSGTLSPTKGIPIGMGYVNLDYAKVGQKIGIHTGKKVLAAEIVKTPFVSK